MNDYRWETHLHTQETSICGQDAAADMVDACKRAGMHGIIVTDHFVGGNSHASKAAPWQKRMDRMLRGYKAAKTRGDAIGMPVLLGWEYAYQGGDFLTYGLEEAFLRDQPDLADITIEEYVRRVHDAGGLVSQAHPFRQAWYMPSVVQKRWDIVDALEVYNGSHTEEERAWDDAALALAKEHDLLQMAGSDAHSVRGVNMGCLAFEQRFDTMEEFLAALRAGEGSVYRNHR